ncbi:MAG TPA: hypothetical protein VMU83_01800, partial [Hanamia sp.]|nr:hypothetical protein [Hanamia sp.]
MKTFYFNIQSKGGAGKSMLTYLQALKHEKNEKAAFVDLDSSTQTSTRQLHFLTQQEANRLFSVDIFDNLKKIEREKLYDVLQAFNTQPFEEIYIDFGAPESEQLPSLFSLDFTIEEFKEFEKELKAKFVFNVILCGGTSYASTFDYLKKLTEIIKGKFEIVMYLNELTFLNYNLLLDELNEFAKKAKGYISKV